MGYATTADITNGVPTSVMSDVTGKLGLTNAQLAAAVIADADAEIDSWNTSGWTSEQKRACSKALAIEGVYLVDDKSTSVPRNIKDRADTWRELLKGQEEIWTAITYDPPLNEEAADLDRLANGDS